jgi:hypothetical protein
MREAQISCCGHNSACSSVEEIRAATVDEKLLWVRLYETQQRIMSAVPILKPTTPTLKRQNKTMLNGQKTGHIIRISARAMSSAVGLVA